MQLFSDKILTKSLSYFAANAEEHYKTCKNKNAMINNKWNYFLIVFYFGHVIIT